MRAPESPEPVGHPVDTDPIAPGPAAPIDVQKIALIVLSVAVIIWLLRYMQPVLLPLVLGGLLFYALDPAVGRLQKLRVHRAVGAALMLFVVVASVGVLAYLLQGQALAVVDQLPAGARKLAQTLRKKPGAEPGALEKVQQAADVLQNSAKPAPAPPGVTRVQVEEPRFQASAFVWSNSVGLALAANQVAMVLFLTYFMLLSEHLFKRKLVEIVGTLSKKKVTIGVLDEIGVQIHRFLVIQLVTSVLVAIVTALALWSIGLEQAALWGLLAGILNSIPYYGPLLVTAGLSVVAYLQFGTVGMTAAVAGVSLLITTLEGWFLTPMLVGRSSSMNQVAVFAGLLFWSWAWGVWGMLLAVPMMMALKSICNGVEVLHPVGHFLGD